MLSQEMVLIVAVGVLFAIVALIVLLVLAHQQERIRHLEKNYQRLRVREIEREDAAKAAAVEKKPVIDVQAIEMPVAVQDAISRNLHEGRSTK